MTKANPDLSGPIKEQVGTVIGKRQDMRSSRGSYSTYYVTFQFEDGSREELRLNGRDYGLLVEGDQGMVKFQGRRYLDFQRFN